MSVDHVKAMATKLPSPTGYFGLAVVVLLGLIAVELALPRPCQCTPIVQKPTAATMTVPPVPSIKR